MIAVLPPDLEGQVRDILQRRGIGGEEPPPVDSTPLDAPVEEGTDALEDDSPLPDAQTQT
jgi:hypothetical protein